MAPRNRRLNSCSLPRLRSQPIHLPSQGFHKRLRWNTKNRCLPYLALSAAIPSAAMSNNRLSSGMVSCSASAQSDNSAK